MSHHAYHHSYHSAKRHPETACGQPEKLYVIAVISNGVRYRSRYSLYKQFEAEMLANPDVVLLTVEAAFGHRPHEVTDACNPHHVQLRTSDEVWHKENMINIGVQHLLRQYPKAKYVAWIDTDVRFQRTDWAVETLHQLQHYQVVQMWSHAIDLGPEGEALALHHSFMKQYITGAPYCYGYKNSQNKQQWHPGYAWAMRVEAWHHLGGLIDTAILGAGDNHMAHALAGIADFTHGKGLHRSYKKHISIWGERAERHIRRNVGHVPGTITHYWHGKKKDRGYHDRWQILVDHQYNPCEDLKRDGQGLWQLVDRGDVRSIRFRDDIRAYFRSRNEDSVDVKCC